MFGKLGTPGDDCRDEAMRRVSHQGDLGSREPVRLRIMEWFLLDGLTVAVPVRLERKGVLAGRCVGVDRLQAVLESFPELRRVEKRQSCMNYLEEDLDQIQSEPGALMSARMKPIRNERKQQHTRLEKLRSRAACSFHPNHCKSVNGDDLMPRRLRDH